MNSFNPQTVRTSTSRGWLQENNPERIVSRRPFSQRVGFGLYAACLLWVTAKVVPHLLPLLHDRAAAPAAVTMALMLISLSVCFLFGTGPNRLCLDSQSRGYSLTQGIFGLTWTRRGQIGNDEVCVSCTRSRQYQVRFRAQHWKYSLPMASLETEQEACRLAREIADKLDAKATLNLIR